MISFLSDRCSSNRRCCSEFSESLLSPFYSHMTPVTLQLYEPYADNPTTNGFMRLDKEVLFKYIPLFLRDGWQVVSSKILHMLPSSETGILECSCYRRSSERYSVGRFRSVSQRGKCHRITTPIGTRSNNDQVGHAQAWKARRRVFVHHW